MLLSDTKLTPGEWKFGVRRDGSMWLSLGDPLSGPHYQGDLVASVPDARAMVAAKDLIEALEALPLDDFDVDPRHLDASAFVDHAHEFVEAMNMARAALKKARGEA